MQLNNNAPLISVIIPTFNRGKFIEKTIRSVIIQTYKNIEIIIVDDCSTDNTKQLIENIQLTNVKYFCLTRNSGAQVARNKGIIESTGEWIAFLDSDDIWAPEKLSKQLAVLEKNNFNKYLVIHSNCLVHHTYNDSITKWEIPKTDGIVHELLLSRPSTLFQGMLTSKLALEEINYLDEDVVAYQEWDTTIRLAKLCEFIHMNEELFTYVLHQDDTISKNKNKEIIGYYYVINKHKFEILKISTSTWNLHILILLIKCSQYEIKQLIPELVSQLKLNKVNYLLFRLFWKKNIPARLKFRILRAII